MPVMTTRDIKSVPISLQEGLAARPIISQQPSMQDQGLDAI